MVRSPRLPLRRTVLALTVASLAIGACGTESRQADDPGPASTTSPGPVGPVEVWAPAGSSPPVVLHSPGDGGTITIRVGDRVQIPPSPDGFGGIRLDRYDGDEPDDRLVPYGDHDTFLAMAPGELQVQDTVYDPTRSCVPPQPVAEFTLVITDGPRPDIGDPVPVTPADGGHTIELVPGQRLAFDADLLLSIGEDELGVLTNDGHALRPGAVEVALSTGRSPTQDDWVSFTVVILDPDGGTATTDLDGADAPASSLRSTSGPLPRPAAPACGG